MKILNSALTFITKNTKLIFLGIVTLLIILLLRQCDSTNRAKNEIIRIKNNQMALNDTIRNYKDKLGNRIGEIRGLRLKISELGDSLEFEKNKEPVTIIEYVSEINENINDIPVVIVDTVIKDYNSAIKFTVNDIWGKSKRDVVGTIPFKIISDSIISGNANLNIKQNIWLTASILEDAKTKEVFVQLKTDYPNVIFNEARGVLIDNESTLLFRRKARKTLGIGLQAGVGYTIYGFSPYIGLGVNYTPKFLQW